MNLSIPAAFQYIFASKYKQHKNNYFMFSLHFFFGGRGGRGRFDRPVLTPQVNFDMFVFINAVVLKIGTFTFFLKENVNPSPIRLYNTDGCISLSVLCFKK